MNSPRPQPPLPWARPAASFGLLVNDHEEVTVARRVLTLGWLFDTKTLNNMTQTCTKCRCVIGQADLKLLQDSFVMGQSPHTVGEYLKKEQTYARIVFRCSSPSTKVAKALWIGQNWRCGTLASCNRQMSARQRLRGGKKPWQDASCEWPSGTLVVEVTSIHDHSAGQRLIADSF